MSKTPEIVFRGRTIRVDDNGLVCISDIWSAAGFSVNQKPSQWRRLPQVGQLLTALVERMMGKSHHSEKIKVGDLFYSEIGKKGGTFAHPIMALAYSEYLSPALAVEVREVFLRFKAADPVLADEILARATPEANEWAGTRAIGRSKRREYTDTLKNHGVTGAGYGQCTNAVYQALFDKAANDLRRDMGIKKSVALRDAMSTDELVYIMASEQLASERIKDEVCHGDSECSEASCRSAGFIRTAIEADRADRQKRRLV